MSKLFTLEEVHALEVSAVEAYRKRIIKLLKKHGKSDWCGEGDCPRPFPTEHLIALLKGENK